MIVDMVIMVDVLWVYIDCVLFVYKDGKFLVEEVVKVKFWVIECEWEVFDVGV